MYINLNTNEEKRCYTLRNYVTKQCEKLMCDNKGVLSNLVFDMLLYIFNCHGSKRGNLKDALFIICLHFVLKTHQLYRPIEELRVKLNPELHQKHISKAEIIFMEIIQREKTKNPFFMKIYQTIINRNLVKDFMDKYSFVLQSQMGMTMDDINKIVRVINKFEEYSKVKNLVYSPNTIITGCIYFYSKIQMTGVNVSLTSMKRIAKEIEKSIKAN